MALSPHSQQEIPQVSQLSILSRKLGPMGVQDVIIYLKGELVNTTNAALGAAEGPIASLRANSAKAAYIKHFIAGLEVCLKQT